MAVWQRAIGIGLLAVCALTCDLGYSRAEENLKSFEFRGHRGGEDINKHFPYWSLGYRGSGLPHCREVQEFYVCDDITIEVKEHRWTVRKVGDVAVKSLYYTFYNGRLFRIDMSFYIGNF